MSADRIDGPIPIHVRAIPAGVVLDMEALTRLVVADVLELLLAADDTSWWDRLHQLADRETDTGPVEGRPEGEFEWLVSELAERSSSRVTLYGADKVLELTRLLREAVAPKSVPSQREAGAA
ncbi:hypothetical protein HRW18_30935 [Streptomyces lunaelactis]|uniref:hypothetical protein n=1 Tax=Streptomyces lunaelactis TaxID=1535768 RepID=UPI0015854AEB|nr:hypothetical protein [Streptomyces lunaelactis]NUK12314.1 hypothetical protein [Streptomyces lunaelactis]